MNIWQYRIMSYADADHVKRTCL